MEYASRLGGDRHQASHVSADNLAWPAYPTGSRSHLPGSGLCHLLCHQWVGVHALFSPLARPEIAYFPHFSIHYGLVKGLLNRHLYGNYRRCL